MKLLCITGAISCDGVLAKKGDNFEVSDEAGEGLITSGDATIVDARGEDGVTKLVQDSIDMDIDESTEVVIGSTRFDGDITDEPIAVSKDAVPDESWTIADIKTWLDNCDRGYPDRAVKAELLSIVEQDG